MHVHVVILHLEPETLHLEPGKSDSIVFVFPRTLQNIL